MENKFWKLRTQLDDLGYRQILVPECVPLVEKLLDDLVHTTESLQKFMNIAKDAVEERDDLQLGAEPYKCDNAKLVKECNDLHLAFLQYRERNEKLQKELKQQISSLQVDKSNSGSEVEKLKRQIRNLQFDLTKRLDHFSASETKNIRTKHTSKSAPSILKNKTTPRSQDAFEFNSSMALANQKISNFTKEIKKLKEEQLHLTEINESYRKQLTNRDREIERLTSMLEGGRPRQALNRDCCHQDVDNKFRQLQEEIDMLKSSKMSLEERLKEAIAKQHEAMKRALCLAERNKQLEKEMMDIDQMALAVEAECNTTVKNNIEKVNRLQDRMHSTILQIQKLERDVADTRREKQEVLADFNALQIEKKHLQSVLETALEEKKCLNDRLNQFNIIEHDLNKEIDRLMQLSASQKQKIAELECKVITDKVESARDINLKSKSKHKKVKTTVSSKSHSYNLSPKTSPVKLHLKSDQYCDCKKLHESESVEKSSLRSRSQHFKPDHKCDCKTLQESESVGKSSLRSRSQSPKRLKKKANSHKNPQESGTSLEKSRSRSHSSTSAKYEKDECSCCKCNSCILQLKQLLDVELQHRQSQASFVQTSSEELQHLRAEKEYFMKEYHRVLEQLKNVPSKPDVDTEIMQKLTEKEQLIESLQHENKSLSQEKYNLMSRLETARDQPDTGLDSFSMRSVVKRLERERDLLRGDVERLEDERNAIRQRLKTMVESQVEEHARLEKTIIESEEQVRKLEHERRDLIHCQGSRRAVISNLEEQCETLRNQLRLTQTELNQLNVLYTQLKNLHEQADRALSDSQGRIIQLEAELSHAHEKSRSVDQDRAILDKEISMLKNDILVMRGNLAQIDQEKDALLITVDDKTERVAYLEQDIKEKDKEILSLEETIAELKKKLSLLTEDTNTREHLYKSVKGEVNNLRQELESAIKAKELALQENRHFHDDLASCKNDSKNARNELEICKRQVEDLKMQLQHYVAEVKRAEDLISQKETERSEMLDQFRNLSHETLKLENNNHTLETEASQIKVQLSVALDHAAELEGNLESQETMIRSYERQISDLTSQVASLEVQAKQYKAQSQHIEGELQSVRDLCVKLDKQKDDLMRQLKGYEQTHTQVDRNLEGLRKENERLQETLSREKSSIKCLDKLLSESRQETIEQRAYNQDLHDRIRELESKIDLLQQKLLPCKCAWKGDGEQQSATEKRHELESNINFENSKGLSFSENAKMEKRFQNEHQYSPKHVIEDSITIHHTTPVSPSSRDNSNTRSYYTTPKHASDDLVHKYISKQNCSNETKRKSRYDDTKHKHHSKKIADCCRDCSCSQNTAQKSGNTCCNECSCLHDTRKEMNYEPNSTHVPLNTSKMQSAFNKRGDQALTFTTSGLSVHNPTPTNTSAHNDDSTNKSTMSHTSEHFYY